MKKKVTEKFLIEFDKQKEITGLSQNKLARMIGYKSGGVSINNLRQGGKVENLQILLGHSKIETTMIYVHIVESEVVKTMEILTI